MDFTPLFQQSHSLLAYQPPPSKTTKLGTNAAPAAGALLLATSVQHRLVLRHPASLHITHLLQAPSPILQLQWSPCGRWIMARGREQSPRSAWLCVWDVTASSSDSGSASGTAHQDGKWDIRIDDGTTGIVHAKFSPCSRYLLAWSEFSLRLNIWSLMEKKMHVVRFPKNLERGLAFRPDGKYMAYMERQDGQDWVGVVDARSWQLVHRFQLNTQDAEQLQWTPDGRFLTVVDHTLIFHYAIYSPDGRCLYNSGETPTFSVIPKDPNNATSVPNAVVSQHARALGMKYVKWSPSGQLLALGTVDGQIHLANNCTWSVLFSMDFNKQVDAEGIQIVEKSPGDGRGRTQAKYDWCESGSFAPQQWTQSKDNGIRWLEWNSNGSLLGMILEKYPTTVFIYSPFDLRFRAVLHHLSPVQNVQWHPWNPTEWVACCQSSSCLYLGDIDRRHYQVIAVPASGILVQKVKWSPDGQSVLIMDHDKFCVGFKVEEEANEQHS